MSNGIDSGRAAHRRTVSIGRLLAVGVVVLVVIVAGYATYAAYLAHADSGRPVLVVYSYSSLLGGNCGGSVVDGLLGNFDAAHDVQVELVCPAGTLVSALVAEGASPGADLVVGLDEITGPEAEARGLVVPYAPPDLAHVNASIADELSSDHAITPYEWGYLALDYNQSFLAATHGAVAHADLDAFATNQSWARGLMIEDPTTDITGEEFLLWEIAYETEVSHAPWANWWTDVAPYAQVAPDWSTAYGAFTAPTGAPSTVVSYSTDPAATAYYGAPGAFNATVSWANGSAYGWRTAYGIGIVRGSTHVALDEAFVDWFLSPAVQEEIPTNEWEYPANETIGVPGVFNYSVPPTEIVPLNGAIPTTQITADLPTWLDEWQSIENAHGP